MNQTDIIKKMRDHHGLKAADSIGMLRVVCKLPTLEGDERTAAFVATTNSLDLDEEVVLPGGADWSYFLANKQIFVDHNYGSDFNVGQMRGDKMIPYIEGGQHIGWKIRAYFYNNLKCPRADDTLAKIMQGGQGMSIGFIPVESGPPTAEEAKIYPKAFSIVRKWRGLEVSVTPLPCNVRCQSEPMVDGKAMPIVNDRKPLVITPARKPLVIG